MNDEWEVFRRGVSVLHVVGKLLKKPARSEQAFRFCKGNSLGNGFVDQGSGFTEQDGALHLQAAFIDQFFGHIGIRAL